MAREIGAFKEKAVGCVLVAGFVISVVSAFLIWMFGLAGVYRGTYTRTPITNQITDAGSLNLLPLMILFLAVGILMMFGGVGYGLYANATSHRGVRITAANFRVLARYCYDKTLQLLTADWDIDAAESPRFYVRGMFEDGTVGEFETSYGVYLQAGEGMTGEAELQGKWLGRFIPYIGERPAS